MSAIAGPNAPTCGAAAWRVKNRLATEDEGLDLADVALMGAVVAITGSQETAFAGGMHGIWGLGLIWSVHETDSFFYSIGRR